jgi:cobalt/nickel transport system ATP-binding protein
MLYSVSVPVIETKGLSFRYPKKEEYILKEVDFALYAREKICLCGPNGGGKSTFLHLLMGLLKPSRGMVLFHGTEIKGQKELRSFHKKVGFVFQDPDDQLFCPTLLEDVAFGSLNMGVSRKKAGKRSMEILEKLGLARYADWPAFNLSGGEKQLAALGTVLSMEPELLILDEPTDALDDNSKGILERILLEFNGSVILVSHEKDFVDKVTSSAYFLDKGTLSSLR